MQVSKLSVLRNILKQKIPDIFSYKKLRENLNNFTIFIKFFFNDIVLALHIHL